MKRAVIIILMLCVPAWAQNTFWVSTTGNDGNNGTTEALAKISIDEALKLFDGDGGTLRMVDGTYDQAANFVGGQIDFDGSITEGDITILSDSGDRTAVVIIPPITGFGIEFSETWATGSVTWRDLTIQSGTNNTALFRMDLNEEMDVTFDNCLLVAIGTIELFQGQTSTGGGTLRKLQIQNGCVLTCVASNMFNQWRDHGLLSIDSSTLDSRDVDTGGSMFNLSLAHGDIIITNSSLTSTTSIFRLGTTTTNVPKIYIYNNTFNLNTGFSDAGQFSYAVRLPTGTTIYGDVFIANNNINILASDINTTPRGISLGQISAFDSTNPPVVRAKILNNTIMMEDTAYSKGIGIELGFDVEGCIVDNNLVSKWRNSINCRGQGVSITNNMIDGADGIRTFGAANMNILNNTIIANDQGAYNARALMFARILQAPEDSSADYAEFTVTGSAWDLSTIDDDTFPEAVINGELLCLLMSSSIASGASAYTFYGVVNNVEDDTDIITVDAWIQVSDGTAQTPAGAFFAAPVVFTHGSVVKNNIIDASNATNCVTYDFNPVESQNLLDFNVYQAGTNIFSNIGFINVGSVATADGSQLSLAEVQAVWADSTWTQIYTNNDAGSIEADPRLDALGRLIPNSPALNAGRRGLDFNGNPSGRWPVGAWGPNAISVQDTRSRHAATPIYR